MIVTEEYDQVRRYDPASDTWWPVPGGDHIPQWADTVGVYHRAKGRCPDRRHRITHTVVTVEVVQEDEE